MNAGATSLRVYDALKRRILELHHRPGERLDPARLSEDLHSSVTPVRDALHLLTGEQLVEARPGDGFHVPPIDAPALEDLYEWNSQVLLVLLRGLGTTPEVLGSASPVSADAPSEAELFSAMARHSLNAEHRRAVAALNDRLHAARLVEARILPEHEAELADLRRAADNADMPALRRVILSYHRRRIRAASELVRGLYRLA